MSLRSVSPEDSKTSVWRVVLSRNLSDGAPPVEQTDVRNYASEEEALRVLFLRRDPWTKTWQEHLRELIYHLPWDEWAPWWICEDPQRAWDAAPEGQALLWVLSRRELALPTDMYRHLAVHLLGQMWTRGALYQALIAGTEESDDVRALVANTLKRTPEDPPPKEPFSAWARRRAEVCALLAVYGARERLYELSWLGEQCGAWGPHGLAERIREVVPKEGFTHVPSKETR